MSLVRLLSSQSSNSLVSKMAKVSYCSSQLGGLGDGAGKGGGDGGAIRKAGGAFGRAEAGQEEQYFHKKQREQLEQLKSELSNEISFHEEQIKQHQDAIKRNKERVQNLDDDNNNK